MRAKVNYRHPFHGINTLIEDIPETLAIANKLRYHGLKCKDCVEFKNCIKLKGNIENSNYCHIPGKRFK